MFGSGLRIDAAIVYTSQPSASKFLFRFLHTIHGSAKGFSTLSAAVCKDTEIAFATFRRRAAPCIVISTQSHTTSTTPHLQLDILATYRGFGRSVVTYAAPTSEMEASKMP
uniref:Uncharacterized protein n=1 Tax=Bactrocera dorsalis TaxID=27457 RepID=A0A034V1R5_BACDO